MKKLLNKADPWTRRAFLNGLGCSLLGVNFNPAQVQAAQALATGNGRAKSVIYLFMQGGISHLDSFDPKPDNAEVRGQAGAIKTAASGVHLSKFFPKLARQMRDVALINSMSTTQGAHDQGRYMMRTSYTMRASIQHPHLGAWVNRLYHNNDQLPGFVKLGSNGRSLGAGYFDSRYSAVPIDDPNKGLEYSQRLKKVSEQAFAQRMELLQQLNQAFRHHYKNREVQAYSDIYADAVKLMDSADLTAFDLNLEDPRLRKRYGQNEFGQGCLMARRLVEHGVSFVDIELGGWDHHSDLYDKFPEKAKILDDALATLLDDLKQRGLLDDTLVVLATEFGRTPLINVNAGRDHGPGAFSCLMAGAGIQGGQCYGKSDARGETVLENKVTPPEFNATIAHALGLDPRHKLVSPSGRPFTLADKAKPITALF